MKKILLLVIVAFASLLAVAQGSPVKWSFTAKKIADKTYEVKLTATVDDGWHIYSQTMAEGGPVPTKITFNRNPLLTVTGIPKEIGDMITRHEDVFDMDAEFYAGKVEFVQQVKLKGNVKTSIGGAVAFMVCTDKQCLPPSTVNFSLSLN